MRPPPSLLRSLPRSTLKTPPTRFVRSYVPRSSTPPPPPPPPNKGNRILKFLTVFSLSAASVYYYPQISAYLSPEATPSDRPEPIIPKATLQFEREKTQQEIQEALGPKSWELPGVYAWGSNVGRVIDPDSEDAFVRAPRRIAYFDGQLLRDVKLTQNFGAAITENGDLVQWGTGFSPEDPHCRVTLAGKKLVKLAVSADRVLALAKNGSVYSIPASSSSGRKEESAPKQLDITPKSLSRGESVLDIRSGLQHALLLTSKGRVFSAAASTADFPSRGQLGIPGLTWNHRPEGPYYQPHEVKALQGQVVKQIAAGSHHSLVLTDNGQVYAFGDNAFGQLGFAPQIGTSFIEQPTAVPISGLYGNASSLPVPKASGIEAGGDNSFFIVPRQHLAADNTDEKDDTAVVKAKWTEASDTRTADVWACGQGLHGNLGNGKWVHLTSAPVKVKNISSMAEFDETKGAMRAIRPVQLSVGRSHAAAVLDNVASDWAHTGADVLFWGSNEYYQLGNRKRSSLSKPSYVPPLEAQQTSTPTALASPFLEQAKQAPRERLQVSPARLVVTQDAARRKVRLQQYVECGEYNTAVYTGLPK